MINLENPFDNLGRQLKEVPMYMYMNIAIDGSELLFEDVEDYLMSHLGSDSKNWNIHDVAIFSYMFVIIKAWHTADHEDLEVDVTKEELISIAFDKIQETEEDELEEIGNKILKLISNINKGRVVH